MINGKLKLRIPNPHGSGDISEGLLNEILKQGLINKDDWNKTK
jgi:hypothetical protein